MERRLFTLSQIKKEAGWSTIAYDIGLDKKELILHVESNFKKDMPAIKT